MKEAPIMDTNYAMDRRGLLGRMALLLGTAALPVEALAAPAAKAKRFLKPAQLKLLSAVADTIIPQTDTPGALAAKVPARLDALLANWASAETRTNIIGALARIDAAAKAQKGKGFAKLSAADRAAVLKPYDEAALKKVPPPPGAPAVNFFFTPTYVADPGYHRIKDLTIDLYYFSEIAASTELTYNHVPGAFQPSVKLTPASRPHLGTGPF
jgi:hypothetical protein